MLDCKIVKVVTAPFWARIIIPSPRDQAWPCVFGQRSHCGFSLSPFSFCLKTEDRGCLQLWFQTWSWALVDLQWTHCQLEMNCLLLQTIGILRSFVIAAWPSLPWLLFDLIFSLHCNIRPRKALPTWEIRLTQRIWLCFVALRMLQTKKWAFPGFQWR